MDFYDTPYGDTNPFDVDQIAPEIPTTSAPGLEVPKEAQAQSVVQSSAQSQPGLSPVMQEGLKKDLDLLTFMEGLRNTQAVEEHEKQIGMSSPLRKQEINPMPVVQAEGLTDIIPDDLPIAMQALTQAFPSMTPTAMLMDPNDRIFYAMSVMENMELRSDLKAPLINSVMRNGKFTPNALSKDWYAMRGIDLRASAPQPPMM